jgi:DNA-binding PadR family transcriptional regulator
MNQYKTEHVWSMNYLSEQFKKEIVQRITKNLLDIQIVRLIQTEPMWGYKIKKQVAEKFDVKLGHGALYPLLKSLEEKGFITSQKQQQKGRTRKTYAMTKKGEQYLEAYRGVLQQQMKNSDVE